MFENTNQMGVFQMSWVGALSIARGMETAPTSNRNETHPNQIGKRVTFTWMAVASAALAVVALGVFFARTAHASGPIYVDADYAGVETGSKTQPFNTIQEAHNASNATVQVDAYGTSDETQITLTPNTCQADFTSWTEYADNPVFGESVDGGPKAYYPSVLYSSTAFDGRGDVAYYKMWFGTSSSKTGYAVSDDGINWITVTVSLTNVNGYHANVLYDADRFDGRGDAAYYKMWYWDVSNSINYATSDDGVNWTNHTANPVITNTLGWGSAPVYDAYVIYNRDGAPDYYEAWIDNNGKIYYITSSDGVTWAGDNQELLLPRESWESSTYSRVSVIKQDGTYHMWYGGSNVGGGNHGIGYAISADGQHWAKSADNPILHRDDGLAWRDNRTYTPRVLYSSTRFDGHGTPEHYKMWFTGKDNAQGNYTIGYAVLNPVNLSHTSGSGQSDTPGGPLGQPFVVGLRDSCGDPAEGVTVTFAIGGAPAGAIGQSLALANGATDGSGEVQTTLTLGDLTGVYTVTASAPGVSGLSVVFTATAELGPAPTISNTLYLPLVCRNVTPYSYRLYLPLVARDTAP